MPRFVTADILCKTHNATNGDINYALQNGVQAYLSTDGTPISNVKELLQNPPEDEDGCTTIVFSKIKPDGPNLLSNFSNRPSGYFKYLCVDVEGFEEVTGKKEVAKPKKVETKKNTNQEKATQASQDRAAQAYQNDVEITARLTAECLTSDKQQSIKQHRERWNELHTGDPNKNVREKAFRAFRQGLPAHLKKDDPAKK